MSMISRSLIAAGLLAGTAALVTPAMANDLVNNGNDEQATVENGPMASSANIVGGGALIERQMSANDNRSVYLQDSFAQQQAPGLVPVIVGSNNRDLRTIYVPANEAPRG